MATTSTPRTSPRPRISDKDWEDIATSLIEEGFLLSALELHSELLEAGKELSTLKNFFSNPGNFEQALLTPQFTADIGRTPSFSTLDSLELSRYSDDSNRENDERVAVLEFELRKAQETIKSLRGSLTKATETNVTEKRKEDKDSIKPHESRALNYLVHEYLLQQRNKLTAITFSEENEGQDFDDWDDVGLNISKPPGLLYLFREYSNYAMSDQEQLNRILDLEHNLTQQTNQLLALKRENDSLNKRLRHMEKFTYSAAGSSEGQTKTSPTTIKRSASQLTPPTHRRERSLDMGTLQRFIGDITTEVTSQSASNTPVQRRKTTAGGALSFTIGEPLLSDMTKDNIPSGHVTSGDQGDDIIKGSLEELTRTRKASLNRGESEDTINGGDDQNAPGDNVTLSEETVHDLEKDGRIVTDPIEPMGEADLRSGADKITSDVEWAPAARQMSLTFRQQLLSVFQIKTDSRVSLEISKLNDADESVTTVLARCLPYIVPNVILAKREELIPLLLWAVANHSGDSKERDKLLHLMFNLIKRPDTNQRKMIVCGCVAFAKHVGSMRLEAELLPQCWEQITHKYHERRLLVAECCGALAPYIPTELLSSLVLSMLQQILNDDKADGVRQAAVKSLAILVAFIDDKAKFQNCWEMLLKALNDSSQLVLSSAQAILLPAVAAWAYEIDYLEDKLLMYFIQQLYTCIKQVSRQDGVSGATEQSQRYLVTLTHLVPWHCASILLTAPFASDVEPVDTFKVTFPKPQSPLLDLQVIVGSEQILAGLVKKFEEHITEADSAVWSSLQWFTKEFFGFLLKCISTVGFSQPELIHSFCVLLTTYCTYFGHTFTHETIKPLFTEALLVPSEQAVSSVVEGKTQLTKSTLPVYVAGVLACFIQDESKLIKYLKATIIDMALYFAPLDSIKATFNELKCDRKYHILLVGVLRDLINHSSAQVRHYIAILLGLMITGVDDRLVSEKVVPALEILSADQEISVCVETVAAFGCIMENVTSKITLEHCHKQFVSFHKSHKFSDQYELQMALLKTVAKTGPQADPVFREEFIIPYLTSMAGEIENATNTTKKEDICLGLIEAYKNISCCYISGELLTKYMLPGLRQLVKDTQLVVPQQQAMVQDLLQECEMKCNDGKSSERLNSSSEGTGDSKSGFFSKLRTQDKPFSNPFKRKS